MRGRLSFQRVDPRAVLSLGGLDRQPHLFPQRAADEAADRMRLPIGRGHGIDKQVHLGRRVSRYVSA